MSLYAEAFDRPEIREQLRVTALDSDTAVYVEVYRRLRQLITDGVLQAGDLLPGEHTLADLMCVGRTSLRTALSVLYEDGYIKIVRGKGSFVLGDRRTDKYKRRFPAGITFPPERIALLGELGKSKATCRTIVGDAFLTDKLSPAEDEEIRFFTRLYYLDGEPAVIAQYSYRSSLFAQLKHDSRDTVEEKLFFALHQQAQTAECECIPVRSVNGSEAYPAFEGDNHVLVATTYLGNGKVIAYSKDYYNSDVLRFRTAIE